MKAKAVVAGTFFSFLQLCWCPHRNFIRPHVKRLGL
jgi:hypothetical protein